MPIVSIHDRHAKVVYYYVYKAAIVQISLLDIATTKFGDIVIVPGATVFAYT